MYNDNLSLVVVIHPLPLLISLIIIGLIMAPFIYHAYKPEPLKPAPRRRWVFKRTPVLVEDRRVQLRGENMFRYYVEGPD